MQYEKRIKEICFQIIYNPDEYNKKSIRIFGEKFVNRNKHKCKIIYNNKIYELKEYFDEIDKNYNNQKLIMLKLKLFNNIINMSYMFYECDTLLSFQYLSKSKISNNLKKEKANYLDKYDLFHSSVEEPNLDYYKYYDKKDIYLGCDQELISQPSSIGLKNDDSDFFFQRNIKAINNALLHFLNSNNINFSNKYIENNAIKLTFNEQSDTKGIKSNHKKKTDKILENNILSSSINLIIIDLSNIFNSCNSLISLLDMSKWNTSNVENMNFLFSGCNSLKSLPDISKWDTKKVRDMERMFSGCKSLISLPDISKWNTSNVTNMSGMLYDCNSFKSLPDLSEWDTTNCYNMESFFYCCNSLLSLPNISRWDTSNIINMSYMFNECELLSSLPDISKWNTSNVFDFSYMFNKCISLLSLPDISKWKTSKVISMKNIFSECNSLIILPDISKWNTDNVTDFSYMFNKCISLFSLPDISKWNTENVSNFNYMFSDCILLKSLPEITKWNLENVKEMYNMFKGCKSLISLPDFSRSRDFYLLRNLAIAVGKKSLIEQFNNFNDFNSNNIDDIYKRNESINPIIINIIYKKKNKKERIKLFDENFVKNNEDKCKIIYGGKEHKIKEYLYDFDINPKEYYKEEIKLQLKIFDIITDMSYMFRECDTLLSFPNILQMNDSLHKEQKKSKTLSSIENNDFTNGDIFPKENSFSSLINSKVTNVSYMFFGCKSLISLPDISKWNTENISDMSYMFFGCNSLISLPDISKWNTENVTNMDRMFYQCHSLTSLPDISKWNTKKVTDMISFFSFCNSLISLPDISKWNISNDNNMSWICSGCLSLVSIPNLSKLDNYSVNDNKNMFSGCFNSLNNQNN